MENVQEVVRVEWDMLKDIKFADDQWMAVQTESWPQTIIDALNKTGVEYPIKINVKKKWVTSLQRWKLRSVIKITIYRAE